MKNFLITFLIIITFSVSLFSQEESEVVTVIGDSLVGKYVNGESVREVIGHVKMNQGSIKITCNKAIQYLRRNEVELIGDVVITQDSVTILTDRGYYFGKDKISYSDTGVILNDGHSTLSAQNGYYYFDEKRAFFYENVMLEDSVTTLLSDKLTYLHEEDKAVAFGNVQIEDSTSTIYADSLIHYKDYNVSYAFNNIKITNKRNNIIITGNELIDLGDSNYTRITGLPVLTQIDTADDGNIDTLIISSLVMEAVEDSISRLIVTDSVKIVRGDFSSVNDQSIYYRSEDKILTYKINPESKPPVLWYENTQLLGDTVNIFLNDNKIEHIHITKNAFILSEDVDYEFRYDQISGKVIKMYFENNKLSKTVVNGNVLSIYYLYEDEGPNGLIKSSSENATIKFDKNRVADVRLYGTPASEYHPENLVVGKEKDFTLPSFIIYKNKPTKEGITLISSME